MSRRRNPTRDSASTTTRICGMCPRPTRDKAYICDHCADALLAHLIDLADWLGTELRRTITGERASAYSGGGGGGDDTDVRMNWRAVEAYRAVSTALAGLIPLTGHHPGHVDNLPNWLTQHVGRIQLHPTAPAKAGALADAVRQAKRVIDLPPDRQLVGPCPDCKTGRVYAEPGKTYGRCDTCRAQHNADDMWEDMLDEVAERPVTAAEAARLALIMGLDDDRVKIRNRIRTWSARGHLKPTESVTGETVYRFGDVWSKLIEGKTA